MADATVPETVEVETGGDPQGAVIWLHGLGADGHDFEPIVPQLALPGVPPLRYVFPHAPVRPVTINGGMAMRAWYDIYSFDRDGPMDEAGIRESGAQLEALIAREGERGIPPERVAIAGFSQGGAIALYTTFHYSPPLAGLLALSTYLPIATPDSGNSSDPDAAVTGQPRSLPVFMAHGSGDPVLPIELGRSARDALARAGFDVDWHEYPMPHAVCPEEIADIGRFITRVFG